MAKSGDKIKTIRNKTITVLEKYPDGRRFTALRDEVQSELPRQEKSTVHTVVSMLAQEAADKVYRPAYGIYRLRKFVEGESAEVTPEPSQPDRQGIKEDDFYGHFAAYLVGELSECTKAIPLGGNAFKDKWGTPDVIGVLKKGPTDSIDFPPEIVSAEIKLDSGQLITAFGQACAYRLFSHRVYLVVPMPTNTAMETEVARLDSLCRLVGIGLVTFKADDKENPDFRIKTRSHKHETDMIQANEYLSRLSRKKLVDLLG